ncbi:hypothetical protein QYF36_015525 [Acer negundo]|nr:hypothetical protein QYF36_015525 [Acer negundo]
MKRQGDKGKYEAFKRKHKLARRNVGTEESVDKLFFLELEDLKSWLSTDHIDAYISLLAKKWDSDPDNFRHSLVLMSSEFYIGLNMVVVTDRDEDNHGGCIHKEPDGYWIVCKVNLLDRNISICDPIRAKKKSNHGERFKQVMPFRRMLPSTELGFDDEDEDYEAVSDGSKLDTVLSMVKEIKEWTEMLHKRMDLFEAELRHYRDDVADIRKELRLRSYHRSRPASSA